MTPLALLALLGCPAPDPRLAAMRAAVDAWRSGEVAAAEGRAADAVVAFAEARRHRPDDVLLAAWHARAVAASGDPAHAARILAEAVEARPDFAVARYNRAAYLARAGALEEAGAELARALGDGAGDPRDAAVDPDFEPHLDAHAFRFLPAPGLEVVSAGPVAPVFWGSRAEVSLEIRGARGPVDVRRGSWAGPAELVRVVHEIDAEVQRLRFTFKAVGEGEVSLGPVSLGDGRGEAEVPEVAFACTAPAGKVAPPAPRDTRLSTPLQTGGDGLPPSVGEVDGRVLVKLGRADRAELDPHPPRPPVTWELHRDGEPVWTLLVYEDVTTPTRARIWSEGGLAVDTTVGPAP